MAHGSHSAQIPMTNQCPVPTDRVALSALQVSFLSIAKPTVIAKSILTLSTAANATITLTPTHHLPVGPSCCTLLKHAKDIHVGEAIWVVPPTHHAATSGGERTSAVPTRVIAISRTSRANGIDEGSIPPGLHSPVLSHGAYPVVDGVVTAFDAIGKLKLAQYALPALIAACKATATCEYVKRALVGELADDLA